VIVADTNLVAYVIIPGTNTPAAERVRAKDSEWIAPPLLRYELMNVVAQAFRQGQVDRDDAARIYRRGLSLVTLEDLPADPITILNLCHSSGCSPYDLEFVRLAMEHSAQLVTEDGKLMTAFPDNVESMASFGHRT
jgi:predicted nucleic acid-binding protein